MNSTLIQKLTDSYHNNSLFIKREDLLPFSLGGNKSRKAEFFFGEMMCGKYDSVVTYGSISSNHCRVISNKANVTGMDCYIISPSEKENMTLNRKMMLFLGAKMIYCDVNNVKQTIDNCMDALRKEGKNPYFIQGGGHGNLGTAAYVECFDEIVEFEKVNNFKFDYIFHASGTGTTQAGLICGKLINNKDTNIVGISIARKNPYGGSVVNESVKEYMKQVNCTPTLFETANFIDKYVLEGYGSSNEYIINTIETVFCKYGIPLDSTYTGKAFWGMEEYIKENMLFNKNLLFLHTGGTPLFFDMLNIK